MTEKRFMVDDAGELIDLNNHKFIDYGEECCNLLNELADENEQYKKNSISLKQLYKILEENKEHFLSLAECFSEKLFIKTIFRHIEEDIESREVLE